MDQSVLLAGVVVAGVACQWLSWFTKIPSILFLLALGLAVGPVLGVLQPDELLGDSFFPFVSLAVSVVLFEGSLSLNFREVNRIGKVIRDLVTVGCLLTCVGTTLTVRLLFDIPWGVAAIFGALMTVSGPAVIAPMLQAIRPTPAVAKILRWEGTLIDPIGASLTVVMYELMLAYYSGEELNAVAMIFIDIFATGLVIGGLIGYGYGVLLRHHLIPEFLQNTTSLGLLFLVFTGSNEIEHESGLFAVTVMGMVLGNMKFVDLRMMLHFKESLSMLLISTLFILLASRLDLEAFYRLSWRGVLLLLVLQFALRPLVVWVCTRRSQLNSGEIKLLSWIAPRGVVAAAVASLLALRLEGIGIEGADMIVPLAFWVIIGTVTFECLTANAMAKRWGVAVPKSRGVLIASANKVSRAIAELLTKNGIQVLLADSSRSDVAEARMMGIDAYYGNVVSEHAEHNMDLIGLGKVLAMGPDRDENSLVCAHFTPEFGKRNVYCVATEKSKKSEKHQLRQEYQGHSLFGPKVTYAKLASLMANGAKLRSTKITEAFGVEDLKKKHTKAIFLFAISVKGDLYCFVEGDSLKPVVGWTILTLVPYRDEFDEGATSITKLMVINED